MRYEDLNLGQAQIGETDEGGFPMKILKFTQSVDLANVAANVNAEQDVTFTGVESGDIPIHLDSGSAAATLGVYPQRCGADNTCTVRATNPTASGINLGAITMTLTVLRPGTRV